MSVRVRASVRGLSPATLRLRGAVMLESTGIGDRELSVLVCGARKMAALNRTWLGREGPTDVLAFPQRGLLLGDVVLCVPVLRSVAREAGRTLLGEATRALAHGILHLAGHHHDTHAAARRMEAATAALVAPWERRASRARSRR